jgi:uncharacterized protein YecE (DUF72 family)
MALSVGTSGYSYKEWLGKFYPEKLPASAMLRFYADHFPTVEINNSFYRMPAETTLARWSLEVPESFTFTLKAPRRITHEKRLRDTGPEVTEFLRRAAALGKKSGPILFQLPPFLKKDLPLLQAFLSLLPFGPLVAFEFRHPSWLQTDVYDALHAKGATLCMAETDDGSTPLVSTSECGYLRLRCTFYEEAALRAWVEQIAAQPWKVAYVYFKHEDEAKGPRFAQQFIALWRTLHRSA